jgi:O-antigen/teichoic acid export membrane protein
VNRDDQNEYFVQSRAPRRAYLHLPLPYTLIDQAIVSGGNFLTIVITAHLIPQADQGILGYIISVYLACMVLNLSAIFQWAAVAAPKKKSQQKYDQALNLLQFLIAFPSSVIGIVAVYFLSLPSGWRGSPVVFIFGFVYLFIHQLQDYFRRSAYIFRGSNRATLASSLTYGLRLALLMIAKPKNLEMVTIILAVSSVPVGSTCIWRLFQIKKKEFRYLFSEIRDHMSGARWLVVNAPSLWLWANLPIFFLGLVRGVEEVAIYVTVGSLARMGNAAMEMLETKVSVEAGKIKASAGFNELQNFIRRIRLTGVLLWIGGCIFLAIGGQNLLRTLFSQSYASKASFLLVGILWITQLSILEFRISEIVLRTVGRTRSIPIAYYGGIVPIVLLGIGFTNAWGFLGAGLLLFLETLVILTIMYRELRIIRRQERGQAV